MKKIIYIIVLILSISLIKAIIIDQEQLDQYNPFNVSLQCQHESEGINDNNFVFQDKKYVVRTKSCLDVNKLIIENITYYNVTRKIFYIYQPHRTFHFCRLMMYSDDPTQEMDYYWNYCKNETIIELTRQYYAFQYRVREKILSYQTEQNITL